NRTRHGVRFRPQAEVAKCAAKRTVNGCSRPEADVLTLLCSAQPAETAQTSSVPTVARFTCSTKFCQESGRNLSAICQECLHQQEHHPNWTTTFQRGQRPGRRGSTWKMACSDGH